MPRKQATPERRALRRRHAAALRLLPEMETSAQRAELLLAVVAPRDDRLIDMNIDTDGGHSNGDRRQEDRQGEADSVPA